MIHARRQESGISRSRASRSDRLYRVSCLFVHFLAPFPPLSHRHLTLFSLLFHAWPATENRELSALPRPYALSLFLGLVVTHTGEKRRANRQPTTREWRPVETSPGLVNPAFFRSDYSISFDMENYLCHIFNEIPENRYRYACEFSSPSD